MRAGTMHLKPDDWQPPLVLLIGLGMGRDDLSMRVLRWIERAEVLAGGARHLECFTEHPARKMVIQSNLGEFIERVAVVSENQRTVVLASGDPFFFGIGRRLVKRIGSERLLVFPNVTSVQALFSRLKEPWEDVKAMSLHGRANAARNPEWLMKVGRNTPVALFTDPVHTPEWIAGRLLDAGMRGRWLVVAEDLGMPSEKIQRLAPEEAMGKSFSPLNLVAILPGSPEGKPTGRPESLPILGLPEAAFQHQAGLITKSEIRAVVLAELQLCPDLVLWDLGAGSGSICIEASRVAPLRQVVAVEKHPGRYKDLLENLNRFDCKNIAALQGNASELLEGLPDPDRVFIGGSGKDLREILRQVEQRLPPGGRVVQTAVTLDTLEAVREFWLGKPFQVNISQVQVNRSIPIGESLRFEALNPIFIISVWPKS